MQDQDYLYAIQLSGGWWAVCCDRCQDTVAVTFTPADAEAIIAAHTCTTTPEREVAR